MLETSARLLRLLALLQSHREWPGSELALRLEVSQRTIRNDIERLRQLGYPVDATRGVAGGYRLGHGATMPPLLLEDDEAVAIAVGLGRTIAGGFAGIEDSSLRALAKLEQVLPTRLRRRVEALRAFSATVPPDDPGPITRPETLALLANACRDREKLRIAYERHDGTTSRRVIDPYRVVNWGRRWYLVAWDDERADWRTFRVDRITRLDPTGLRFPDRGLPATDITAYIATNVSRAAWRFQTRVIMHAPIEEVIPNVPPAVGVVERIDDTTCALITGADSIETMAVWIGLIDIPFTVTEPPELIAKMRELATRYGRATASSTS